MKTVSRSVEYIFTKEEKEVLTNMVKLLDTVKESLDGKDFTFFCNIIDENLCETFPIQEFDEMDRILKLLLSEHLEVI